MGHLHLTDCTLRGFSDSTWTHQLATPLAAGGTDRAAARGGERLQREGEGTDKCEVSILSCHTHTDRRAHTHKKCFCLLDGLFSAVNLRRSRTVPKACCCLCEVLQLLLQGCCSSSNLRPDLFIYLFIAPGWNTWLDWLNIQLSDWANLVGPHLKTLQSEDAKQVCAH